MEQVAAESNLGEQLEPFIQDPESTPSSLLSEAIFQRLKKPDCVEKGWILDGYPTNKTQAELLNGKGFSPNRYFK